MRWPFRRKRREQLHVESFNPGRVDWMDPHGDGTIREGDAAMAIFQRCLETGEPVVGRIYEDGTVAIVPEDQP